MIYLFKSNKICQHELFSSSGTPRLNQRDPCSTIPGLITFQDRRCFWIYCGTWLCVNEIHGTLARNKVGTSLGISFHALQQYPSLCPSNFYRVQSCQNPTSLPSRLHVHYKNRLFSWYQSLEFNCKLATYHPWLF